MFIRLKEMWDDVQELLDVRGDVVMLVMSVAFIVRILAVLKGYPGISMAEAAFYGSAIGSFAYSNKQ